MASSRRRSPRLARRTVKRAAGETDDEDHRRHRQQRALGETHHLPELVEGHAGQYGEEWLAGVTVDLALQPEDGGAAFQADQSGGDLLWLQVELAHVLGGDRQSRQRRAAGPVEMDRLDRLEADVQRAVDRCPGARENADDGERLVLVFGEAAVAHAVADDDAVAEPVAEPFRHFGAEYRFEETGEGHAGGEGERLPVAVAKVFHVVGGRSEHRLAAVRITER